jgi:hypothetical protein
MRHHRQSTITLAKRGECSFEGHEPLVDQCNGGGQPQHQPGVDGVLAGRAQMQ